MTFEVGKKHLEVFQDGVNKALEEQRKLKNLESNTPIGQGSSTLDMLLYNHPWLLNSLKDEVVEKLYPATRKNAEDILKHPEYQYLHLMRTILDHGEIVSNRTGTDTRRYLGGQMEFDFKDGFPLFTTKQVFWKGIVHELLWFLSGSTNIKYLVDNGVNIWNDDAYRYYKQRCKKNHTEGLEKDQWFEKFKDGRTDFGELGPVYGKQWRKWYWPNGDSAIDQIANLVVGLKNNPTSRRHILTAWNVAEIDEMALPPCHIMSQYTVKDGNRLWCQVYQRSCDMPLGVPFNVASYSLLVYMLAQVTGLEPGGVIWSGHDCHIYLNQVSGVEEQLKREPLPFPTIQLDKSITNINDFKFEHIKLVDYKHHSKIDMPLST